MRALLRRIVFRLCAWRAHELLDDPPVHEGADVESMSCLCGYRAVLWGDARNGTIR